MCFAINTERKQKRRKNSIFVEEKNKKQLLMNDSEAFVESYLPPAHGKITAGKKSPIPVYDYEIMLEPLLNVINKNRYLISEIAYQRIEQALEQVKKNFEQYV